jgi:hypothetical protein
MGTQEADDEPMKLSDFARECSAIAALFASGEPIDIEAFGYDFPFTAEEAECMADFVRDNPQAPLLAMYKHLEISKRLQPAEPNAGDMLVLALFHAAVTHGVAFERAKAAEAEQPEAPRTAVWPGDRSFKVQDPAFSPTGFAPR